MGTFAREARSGRWLPSDDFKPLELCILMCNNRSMPELYKKKRKLVGARRLRKTLSFDPAVVLPFEELCNKGGMSLSRAFEGMAEVFLKSMNPGDDFRREYVRFLSLYYNYRRDIRDVPRDVEFDDF